MRAMKTIKLNFLDRIPTEIEVDDSGEQNQATSDTSLCCLHCNEKFASKRQNKDHCQEFHKNETSKKDRRKFTRYLCNLCDKHFADYWTLKHHQKTVHSAVRDHSCETCGKCFLSKKDLRRHVDGVHLKKKIVYPGTVRKVKLNPDDPSEKVEKRGRKKIEQSSNGQDKAREPESDQLKPNANVQTGTPNDVKNKILPSNTKRKKRGDESRLQQTSIIDLSAQSPTILHLDEQAPSIVQLPEHPLPYVETTNQKSLDDLEKGPKSTISIQSISPAEASGESLNSNSRPKNSKYAKYGSISRFEEPVTNENNENESVRTCSSVNELNINILDEKKKVSNPTTRKTVNEQKRWNLEEIVHNIKVSESAGVQPAGVQTNVAPRRNRKSAAPANSQSQGSVGSLSSLGVTTASPAITSRLSFPQQLNRKSLKSDVDVGGKSVIGGVGQQETEKSEMRLILSQNYDDQAKEKQRPEEPDVQRSRVLEDREKLEGKDKGDAEKEKETSGLEDAEEQDEEQRVLPDDHLPIFHLDNLDNLPIILPEFSHTSSQQNVRSRWKGEDETNSKMTSTVHPHTREHTGTVPTDDLSRSRSPDQLETIQIIRLGPGPSDHQNVSLSGLEDPLCYLGSLPTGVQLIDGRTMKRPASDTFMNMTSSSQLEHLAHDTNINMFTQSSNQIHVEPGEKSAKDGGSGDLEMYKMHDDDISSKCAIRETGSDPSESTQELVTHSEGRTDEAGDPLRISNRFTDLREFLNGPGIVSMLDLKTGLLDLNKAAKCDKCNKHFLSHYFLTKHISQVHNQKDFLIVNDRETDMFLTDQTDSSENREFPSQSVPLSNLLQETLKSVSINSTTMLPEPSKLSLAGLAGQPNVLLPVDSSKLSFLPQNNTIIPASEASKFYLSGQSGSLLPDSNRMMNNEHLPTLFNESLASVISQSSHMTKILQENFGGISTAFPLATSLDANTVPESSRNQDVVIQTSDNSVPDTNMVTQEQAADHHHLPQYHQHHLDGQVVMSAEDVDPRDIHHASGEPEDRLSQVEVTNIVNRQARQIIIQDMTKSVARDAEDDPDDDLDQIVVEDTTVDQPSNNTFSPNLGSAHSQSSLEKRSTMHPSQFAQHNSLNEEVIECDPLEVSKQNKRAMTDKEMNNDKNKAWTEQMDKIVYACEQCDKFFRAKSTLTKHRKLEHNLKLKFTCYKCHVGFSSEQVLKEHISSVHDMISNICPTCFKPVIDLIRHIRLQHKRKDERKYKCDLCSKSFRTKFACERHRDVVHLKKKPWSCQLCEKVFSVKRDVHRHIKTVHFGFPAEGNKHWICPICETKFDKRAKYDRHKQEDHVNSCDSDLLKFVNYELTRKGKGLDPLIHANKEI